MTGQGTPRNVFVGGTGRSGTTIVAEIVGSHPDICSFEREMRFHIDPYGLRALHTALTENFSPPVSREAWIGFEQLMSVSLTNRARPPYIGFDLERFFGPQPYRDFLENIRTHVTFSTWRGYDYHVPVGSLKTSAWPLLYIIERVFNFALKKLFNSRYRAGKVLRFIPARTLNEMKFFQNSDDLARFLGTECARLFQARAQSESAKAWCEQTPGNALNAHFLARAFPDSCLIYSYRNPWSLALSYQRQDWAPGSLDEVCQMLRYQLDKWLVEKERLEAMGYPFIEVSLDDLTDNTDATMDRIADLIGVEPTFPLAETLDRSRHEIDVERLSAKDREILTSYFGDYRK